MTLIFQARVTKWLWQRLNRKNGKESFVGGGGDKEEEELVFFSIKRDHRHLKGRNKIPGKNKEAKKKKNLMFPTLPAFYPQLGGFGVND